MTLHDRLATTLLYGIGRVIGWVERQRGVLRPRPADRRVTLAADALCRSVDCDPDREVVEEIVSELPAHEQEALILLGDQA